MAIKDKYPRHLFDEILVELGTLLSLVEKINVGNVYFCKLGISFVHISVLWINNAFWLDYITFILKIPILYPPTCMENLPMLRNVAQVHVM